MLAEAMQHEPYKIKCESCGCSFDKPKCPNGCEPSESTLKWNKLLAELRDKSHYGEWERNNG